MDSPYATIFLLLMIVDGIFTMINLGVLLVMVKLYTEILKIRELTRSPIGQRQ